LGTDSVVFTFLAAVRNTFLEACAWLGSLTHRKSDRNAPRQKP
jgi:hypothetical protein